MSTYRYRYINPTPVVFTAESWAPELGEEREFDHEIDHPFLQLVVPPVETIHTEQPPVTDEAKDTAVDGDKLKES